MMIFTIQFVSVNCTDHPLTPITEEPFVFLGSEMLSSAYVLHNVVAIILSGWYFQLCKDHVILIQHSKRAKLYR